jgi:IS30 family transposase
VVHFLMADVVHFPMAANTNIESFSNDRPRKCLGRKTPREVIDAFLVAAA